MAASRKSSPASSTSSSSSRSPSPSPAQRKKKCLKHKGAKWSKVSPKKSSPSGKKIKPYGRCVKTSTAWMVMMKEMWKHTEGKMSYTETMKAAHPVYVKYAKTHKKSDGSVVMKHSDIVAAVSAAMKKK